ncbi:MAG: family 43 glycosylhydrolase [Planctomycetes bacterium]|nr:family 43 glycosylhydrolase [Planctomycetota bacterium]
MLFKYKNPIYSLAIEAIRDCQITKVDDIYYLTGTSPPFWEGPNPGVKLYSSKNLLNWKFENLLIDRAKLAPNVWYYDRFWAPEIHHAHGRFWLTFNCRNETAEPPFPHSTGLAVADSITGPYEILTHDKPLIERTNDATLFTDDDGKTYIYFVGCCLTGSDYIMGWEIDLEACELLGDAFVCLKKIRQMGHWERAGIEAPFVIKRDGIYYMFYSGWARGYEVGYATASHPKGPWKRYEGNPIFGAQDKDACEKFGGKFTGNPPGCPYVAAGHNAIFTGPDGRDWLVCHYQEKGKPETLGFDPIWIENGIIKTNGPTWTEQIITV